MAIDDDRGILCGWFFVPLVYPGNESAQAALRSLRKAGLIVRSGKRLRLTLLHQTYGVQAVAALHEYDEWARVQ